MDVGILLLSPIITNVQHRWSAVQCSTMTMRNAGLDEAQAGIKIARRKINNLRYADDTTLMAESEEELNSLLMRVKVESDSTGLGALEEGLISS